MKKLIKQKTNAVCDILASFLGDINYSVTGWNLPEILLRQGSGPTGREQNIDCDGLLTRLPSIFFVLRRRAKDQALRAAGTGEDFSLRFFASFEYILPLVVILFTLAYSNWGDWRGSIVNMIFKSS